MVFLVFVQKLQSLDIDVLIFGENGYEEKSFGTVNVSSFKSYIGQFVLCNYPNKQCFNAFPQKILKFVARDITFLPTHISKTSDDMKNK